jgi:hypothetical protein
MIKPPNIEHKLTHNTFQYFSRPLIKLNNFYVIESAKLSQPHFGLSVRVKPTLPKSGNLESSGIPENSEDDLRGQISSHRCALGIIGKVFKCRCPKWPRMSHLDICSPSYGQKKGRESKWQFDSRPLKVGNRPVPNVRSESATRRWKALFEGYNFGLDLVPIGGRGEKLWSSKVPGQKTIRMPPPRSNAEYTIGSMVVASPESGPWCVL